MRLRQSLGAWALLSAGVLAGCPGQGVFTWTDDGSTGEVRCADGVDDDADGQADCLDADCDELGACEHGQERSCNDSLDNDGDGLTDRDDSDCPADQPVCGDAACNGGEDCSTCAGDCGSCPPECGNGSCDADETCENCPQDCQACPPACGDGDCEGPENCATCEVDCGTCPATCGNATCEADEDCVSCEADCGACPACGDGSCDAAEACASCPADCGVCPPSCGDDRCDAAETCTTCPGDCGQCPAPWSFFVLGDSRSNASIFRDNLTSMNLLDPSAVLAINVGDLTAQGLVSEWDVHQNALATAAPDPAVPADPTGVVRQSRFRTDVTDFGPYIRYLGVIGNHDLGNTAWHANWNKYLPGQAGLGVNATTGIYFSFLVRDALFIVLDSQHPSSAQTAWLQSLLESPEGQSAKWKFAYFHRPIYPCNGKSPFSGGLPWASLFEAHDVKLVWVADSHTYERTCAMRGGTCAADGVIYLNTSGAGAEVRSVDATRTATVTSGSRSDTYRCAEILARHREYWHHFCHVQMTDCQSTIRCYGHQYHTTREGPFDTLVIDRCN